jgi:riboflavin kinase/FMN adenylyltransferase
MQIVHNLEHIPTLSRPIALAIGMFDGVHLGHQHLFQELAKHGTPVVLTFSNHPAEVLGRTPPKLLCTLEEKLQRLKQAGIALTIVLPFTSELAKTSYDQFLKNLKAHLPFTTLMFGKGDSLGYKREGNESHIKDLEQLLGFTAIYLEKFSFEGEAVSSRRIRELLKNDEKAKASLLLHRGESCNL